MPVTEFTIQVEHRFNVGDRIRYNGRSQICHTFYNKNGATTVTGLVYEQGRAFYITETPEESGRDSVAFVDHNFDRVKEPTK